MMVPERPQAEPHYVGSAQEHFFGYIRVFSCDAGHVALP